MDKKAKVFVIMPFSDEFFDVYGLLKNHFENDFEFSNAGDEDNQQNILADIIQPIFNADIVLADLTGLNPNVMYELGLAHSFNKKTIVITQNDLNGLPFDLKQYRAKNYSTHFKSFQELISYLEKNLYGAKNGEVVFNNPVSDFLNSNNLDLSNLFNDKYSVDISEGENGFLDFMADIETDITKMTENINNISDGMDKMSQGMNACAEKIDIANKNGGNGTASFVRKQAKKAAEFIREFCLVLNNNNNEISTIWTRIEKNTFGLLENDFASKEENKDALIGFLKELYDMQQNIVFAKQSISELKVSSQGNMGIERTMNQAIRSMDEDLKNYINTMEQQIASIDSIIAKSKFVVGTIDFTTEENENG